MKWLAMLVTLFFVASVDNSVGVCVARDDANSDAEAAPKSPAHLLQYKFRLNQRLDYEVKHNSSIRMTKGASRGSALNESETRKHYTVVSIDRQGNAILEPVIDWVKMSVQFDGKKKKTFDSRSGQKPDKRFVAVARTVGKSLVQLKIAPNGELLKAAPLIPRQLQKQVVKKAGAPTPANDASKNFLVVFPTKPIRVGDAWTDAKLTVQLQVGGGLPLWQKFTISRRYQLISIKEGLATLKLTMAPKKPVNNPRLRVQLAQRLISGTIVFDLARGVIVSRSSAVDEKIIGFAANQSIMHVKSQRSERLLSPKQVADGRQSTKTQ